MKKIFTLIVVLAAAVNMQAAITVHVKADEAPHLWAWTAAGDVFASEGWPGIVLTDKKTVQGTEFWYYTFAADVTSVNIIFNNGSGGQTGNITGITSDRYFTYDGTTGCEDISEQYVEVPDAEVTSLTLAGNHNGWSQSVEAFNVVEAGKTFAITVDLSEVDMLTTNEDFWIFKICPNAQDWVGYWEVTLTAEPAWLTAAEPNGDFKVDLDGMAAADRKFNLTATWGGGKKADANWTFTIAQGATGINTVLNSTPAENAPRYDLSGRQVTEGYRGVVIQNGKKVVVK